MSIEIKPDSKTLRNYRIVFALCGLNLITIFAPNFLGFDSFLNLPPFLEGMAATLTGIGLGLLFFKGMFDFNFPVILINETEIHAKHDYWSQRFAWKRLTRVSLYKDKQFLKNGDYTGFARHRLKEARTAFAGGFCFFLLFMVTGVSYFLQYSTGTGSVTIQLTISVLTFVFGIAALFYSTKEYYSVKSSMSLLLNLLEEERTSHGESLKILETS